MLERQTEPGRQAGKQASGNVAPAVNYSRGLLVSHLSVSACVSATAPLGGRYGYRLAKKRGRYKKSLAKRYPVYVYIYIYIIYEYIRPTFTAKVEQLPPLWATAILFGPHAISHRYWTPIMATTNLTTAIGHCGHRSWPLATATGHRYSSPLLATAIGYRYRPPLTTIAIAAMGHRYGPPLWITAMSHRYEPPLWATVVGPHYWPPLLVTRAIGHRNRPPLLATAIDHRYWPPLLTTATGRIGFGETNRVPVPDRRDIHNLNYSN